MRAACAILLPLLVCAAQTPELVFRSGTRLVVEAVVVAGRDGRVVEGLSERDFQITENGVPQRVARCEFASLTETAALASPAPAAAPGPAGEPASATAPASTSNRRLLVLYFDLSQLGGAGLRRSVEAAVDFVARRMQASDAVAVMAFRHGRLDRLEPFTSDRDRLMKSLRSVNVTAAEQDSSGGADKDAGEFGIFTTDRSLAGLQSAMTELGRRPEPKALVYFAAGLRAVGLANQAQRTALLNAAIGANVSIFPVDAGGLKAEAPMGGAERPGSGGVEMYNGGAAQAQLQASAESEDTFYALAAGTGGRPFVNRNDLVMGVVEAQRSIGSHYSLEYYSTNEATDGKFRRIVISLAGHPEYRLSYRRGYFAPKQFNQFTEADRERQLEEALALDNPLLELNLKARISYFQMNRAEYFVSVTARVPAGELGGARMDFIGEIRDANGVIVQLLRDHVSVRPEQMASGGLKELPVDYDTGYTLLPGAYRLKLLARDNSTGAIGTYVQPFVIPNLNRGGPALPISSVVLSTQEMPLRDALFTAGRAKSAVATPLVRDGRKLIPSVSHAFKSGADLRVMLQAYRPGAQSSGKLTAYVALYRDNQRVSESEPREFEVVRGGRIPTVPILMTVPLAAIAAGEYQCQVTILDKQGQRAAFWRDTIVVLP